MPDPTCPVMMVRVDGAITKCKFFSIGSCCPAARKETFLAWKVSSLGSRAIADNSTPPSPSMLEAREPLELATDFLLTNVSILSKEPRQLKKDGTAYKRCERGATIRPIIERDVKAVATLNCLPLLLCTAIAMPKVTMGDKAVGVFPNKLLQYL